MINEWVIVSKNILSRFNHDLMSFQVKSGKCTGLNPGGGDFYKNKTVGNLEQHPREIINTLEKELRS